jgi:hypothetical protein
MKKLVVKKQAAADRRLQRVNIDFPTALLKRLDREAARYGVPRAALIKMWLAERCRRQYVQPRILERM